MHTSAYRIRCTRRAQQSGTVPIEIPSFRVHSRSPVVNLGGNRTHATIWQECRAADTSASGGPQRRCSEAQQACRQAAIIRLGRCREGHVPNRAPKGCACRFGAHSASTDPVCCFSLTRRWAATRSSSRSLKWCVARECSALSLKVAFFARARAMVCKTRRSSSAQVRPFTLARLHLTRASSGSDEDPFHQQARQHGPQSELDPQPFKQTNLRACCAATQVIETTSFVSPKMIPQVRAGFSRRALHPP